jgi:hypothetical protein
VDTYRAALEAHRRAIEAHLAGHRDFLTALVGEIGKRSGAGTSSREGSPRLALGGGDGGLGPGRRGDRRRADLVVGLGTVRELRATMPGPIDQQSVNPTAPTQTPCSQRGLRRRHTDHAQGYPHRWWITRVRKGGRAGVPGVRSRLHVAVDGRAGSSERRPSVAA